MVDIDWALVIETEREEINRMRGTTAPHDTITQGEETMPRPKNADIEQWSKQPWNTLTSAQGRHAIKRSFPKASDEQVAQIEHIMDENPAHSVAAYAGVVSSVILASKNEEQEKPAEPAFEPTPDNPVPVASWTTGMILDELPEQVKHTHPVPGDDLAAKALANPGRWVIVAVYDDVAGARSVENRRKAAASVARAINRGQRVAFRPAGAFEARLVEPAVKPGTYLVAVKARETQA